MRTWLILALFTCLAYGQKSAPPGIERVFSLLHVESRQDFQQILNVIKVALQPGRGVVDTDPQLSDEIAHKTLTVNASVDQIGLIEWLLGELDQAPAQQIPDSILHEYRPPGSNEVVRVFYLRAASPQNIQKLINTVRALADLQRLMPEFERQAIVARGNSDQIGLAEWLVNNLDTLPAPQTPGSAVLEYRLSGAPADVARVFYLANIRNAQDLQKIVIAIRVNTNIQRLMPVDLRMAIALRGTDAQVVAAQRLVAELDTTASAR